jgi:hypothetical protein
MDEPCTTIHYLLPGAAGVRVARIARRAGGAAPPRPARSLGIAASGVCMSLKADGQGPRGAPVAARPGALYMGPRCQRWIS